MVCKILSYAFAGKIVPGHLYQATQHSNQQPNELKRYRITTNGATFRVHPALSWVEVETAAVEKDGGLEVFPVSVATHSALDSHDLAVDSFGHRVGDSVCAVANHIRQSLLNALGNLLQRSQLCMDHPFVPIFEKDGGRGCIFMMPKVT
jgi:hypothetical protein